MNILCVGDIFGKPGRKVLKERLSSLVEEKKIDFVLVNVDNAAGGKGITIKVHDEFSSLPINVMTGGNHIWEKKCIRQRMDSHPILRPYNVAGMEVGKGFCLCFSKTGVPIAVIHLQGLAFMGDKGPKMKSPFEAVDALLKEIASQAKIILVDVHAEASAEKRALGWYLDGQISALFGTHTHIQTADEEILPKGTAYITDLGMTGPHASVIGLDVNIAIKRFLSQGKVKKFKVASGDLQFQGILIDVDEQTGKARSIERIREKCFETDNRTI